MIESSFCVLSGVGLKTERRLWQGGVGTWTEFLSSDSIPRHRTQPEERLRCRAWPSPGPTEQKRMRDTSAIHCYASIGASVNDSALRRCISTLKRIRGDRSLW